MNKPVIVQPESYTPPRIIDFSNGVTPSEIIIILLVLTSFFSKVIPVVQTGQKVYNSIIYINKDELKLKIELQKLLDQLLVITYADRIVIGLFHNGSQDLLGFHEKKMSVYAEACTDIIAPVKEKLQAIPINYMLEEILMADTIYYQTVVRSDLNSACDIHMDSLQIVRKDFRTFRGVRKEIYGIINFHYANQPEEHFLEDSFRTRQVDQITRRIEHILESIKAPNTPKWKRFLSGLVKNFF